MKNLLKYIYILFGVLACTSCSLEEMCQPDSSRLSQVKFIARPTGFTGYSVETRSSATLTQLENKVSTAYFLAFNNKGERFYFEDLTEKLQNNASLAMTLRSDIRTTEITVCWLANVSYDYASSIRIVADLESKPLDIVYADPNLAGAIGVPALKYKSDSEEEYCFPMFCAKTFDLTTIGTAPVTMELKRLFARMDVELSLNLAGEDDHKNKFFTLVDYSVINLPDKVKLFDQLDTMAVENVKDAVMSPNNWDAADMAQTFTTDRLFDGDATFGQNQGVSFTFYAPEHFVNPVTPTTGLPDDYDSEAEEKKVEKQKYKPLFVGQGQYPTLMRFKGLYVEVEAGEELVKTLTYDIYLGRDNFQDFCIFRNYKYNNKISITDTQNFKDGGWLGVDHRVDLETKGFLVGFKRATLLDAHYEVRPMRVRFPIYPAAGTVSVEILKEDKTPAGTDEMPWIRLERPASSDRSSATHYANGKRKYFTTDLVSATLKNNVRIEYDPHDGTEGDLEGLIPIWVYVDEYAVAADDNAENKNRKAIIRVTFTPDEITENSGVVSQSFIVQQRAMYPISYDSRTYKIEYFEEYLYNFDGEENYGEEGGEYVGQNGIIWGMKGKQLSQLYQSMFMNSAASGFWEDVIEFFMNMTLSNISPKYDYYLSRDLPESVYDYRDKVPVTFTESEYEAVTYRDYAGYTFNLETILNNNINDGNNLLLNDQPSSALEYCYKKNKAGSGQKEAIYVESTSGSTTTYNTANFKWYLPAIDEMEDIIMGGKDVEFFNDIFTKSLYWSCQTSFNRNYLYYNTVIDYSIFGKDESHRIGEYYVEDINNARATKLVDDAFLASGSINYSGLYYMYYISTQAGNPVVVEDTTDPLELYYHVYERRQTGIEDYWWGSYPIYETKWWQDEKIHTFAYEVDDPGVRPRDEFNRVRCIYNPTPPKQIKKTVSNGNTTYELVY